MRKKKFTYKQKKMFFFVFVVLISVLGYKRVVSKTVNEGKRYVKNLNIKKNEEEVRKSILNAQRELSNLEILLGDENINEHLVQQSILEFITSKTIKGSIVVTDISAPHSFSISNYLIITNSFTLRGTYNSLIQLVYDIEQDFRVSKLNSSRFYKQMNYKKKEEELFVELLFQNFKELK